MGAANQEYQDILTQIGTIGGTTEYNGIAVFSGDQTTSQLTWAAGAGTPAASASATAAAVAGSSIVAGGTTAGSAPTVTQTYAAPASVAWASGGSGTTLTATFTPGDKLAGTLQFTPTWSSGSPTAISIDESKLDNSSQANLVSSLQAALNTAASGDYTVSAGANNKVIIGIAGSPTDAVTKINTDTSADTTEAAPTGFTMAVTDGDLVSGTIDLTGFGSGASGLPASIVLSDVNTADLASVVGTDLNGTSQTPDYTVSYSAGTLTVGLASPQAGTDKITGLMGSDDSGNALTAAALKAATITFAAGDTLSGSFSITPTINGSAASGSGITTVNLAGVSTANSGAAVIAAVNSALGSAASDYTVGYANNKLSIAVVAANTDGVDSVSIANGSGNNALSQGTSAVSVVSAVNTVMGNFTVTPTTGAGTGSAVNVGLQGVTPATLASSVQTALGADYLVSYSALTGALNIAVSSAGVAAGVTGFTVAEATQAAASQETPINGGVDIYTSDGTTTGSQNYNVTVGALSDASVGTSPTDSAMGEDISATVGNVMGMGGVAGAGRGHEPGGHEPEQPGECRSGSGNRGQRHQRSRLPCAGRWARTSTR